MNKSGPLGACHICGVSDGACVPCEFCDVPKNYVHHECMGIAHPSVYQLSGVMACLECLPRVIETN
eukprot:2198704-Prymnesium_polylepis.1